MYLMDFRSRGPSAFCFKLNLTMEIESMRFVFIKPFSLSFAVTEFHVDVLMKDGREVLIF